MRASFLRFFFADAWAWGKLAIHHLSTIAEYRGRSGCEGVSGMCHYAASGRRTHGANL
jgi:hypothetical protein